MLSTSAPKGCGQRRVCPARDLAAPPSPVPHSCPPSYPQSALAKGTSTDTEGAELSLGVSSFLRGYQFLPLLSKAQVSGQGLAPTLLVGRGLRSHQAPWLPLVLPPHPLAPEKQKIRGPEGLIWPHHHWVGEGGKRGTPPLHSSSTTDSTRHFHRRKFPEVRGGKRLIPFIQWAPPSTPPPSFLPPLPAPPV